MKYRASRKKQTSRNYRKQKKSTKYNKKNQKINRTRKAAMKGGSTITDLNGSFLSKAFGTPQDIQDINLNRNVNYVV